MAMSADTGFPPSLLGLPDEVLLMICSLLPTGDILAVRKSCRRFRDIASDPSLWRDVAFSYRGPPDDKRFKSVMKLTVPHARKFALVAVYKCPTSKFLSLLKQSPSVSSVSLLGYHISQIELNTIVSALPRLMDLKVQLTFEGESDIIAALECTSRLQSLVVTYHADDSSRAQVLRVWSSRAGYNPPELGLQLLPKSYPWGQQFPRDVFCVPENLPSTKHEARLLLYDFPSAFTRLSDLVIEQVEFRPSQSPVVACLQLSSTELTGDLRVYLSSSGLGCCDYRHGTTARQGTSISQSHIPSSLTHLFLDRSESLTSYSLEVLAKHCPRLIRLSLSCCKSVLEELQGLGAIAVHCPRLEDLSLRGIHCSSVECVDSLWNILGQMRLIRLVVETCMLGCQAAQASGSSASNVSLSSPHATAEAEGSIGITPSLTALEVSSSNIYRCRECRECHEPQIVREVVWSFVSTSLEYIRLSNFHLVQGLLERVQQLKYLYLGYVFQSSIYSSALTGCYSCLEQVYINYGPDCYHHCYSHLTEDDITTITSGGKITHAFLSVGRIDKESILHFIQNSPHLVMFCVETGKGLLTRQCVSHLRMVAKSRGVLTFKCTFKRKREQNPVWKSNGLPAVHLTKLLPIFGGY